jgi:hypothetical protein
LPGPKWRFRKTLFFYCVPASQLGLANGQKQRAAEFLRQLLLGFLYKYWGFPQNQGNLIVACAFGFCFKGGLVVGYFFA